MSIYRRKNSLTGKRAKRWTAEFTYQGRLVRRNGFADRDSAQFWLASESLKLRRASVGYVKPMLKALVAPLVTEWTAYLRTRGCDAMYIYIAERRILKLAEECGWLTLQLMSKESMEGWLQSESKWRSKIRSARTKNQFLDTAIEFGKWLSKVAKKLPMNPMDGIQKLPAKHNDAYRRAGSAQELSALLSTCNKDRRLYYLFRMFCPLRGKTIARLTWGMLKLDATPPWIELPPELNKSKRAEKSPLRYDVAGELRKAKKRARADDLVFPTPPTLDDFKADLEKAGIAFDDGKNSRRLDYHALRKTLIRLLKAAGVSVDQASLLLHHKDPRTTRKYYDDDSVEPVLTDAMEKLPGFNEMRRAQ